MMRNISQGSVVTRLRRGGTFGDDFIHYKLDALGQCKPPPVGTSYQERRPKIYKKCRGVGLVMGKSRLLDMMSFNKLHVTSY